MAEISKVNLAEKHQQLDFLNRSYRDEIQSPGLDDCPDKVSVGALTALVANDEILTDRGNDIQLLVDCLEDGEVLFLNTTSIVQPKSTVRLEKEVTVSGLDPLIERRIRKNENKKAGGVPAGRTGARITCPKNKELFIMSNKAKIANLVIQECEAGAGSLDFESNLYAKNIVTSAPVVVRDCKGPSEAGVFFSSFRNNTSSEQSASILVSKDCTLDINQVEFVSNTGFISALVVYGEAKISQGSFSLNGFLEPKSLLSLVGGAILCSGGSLTVKKSRFSENTANSGGAIAASDCDLFIEASMFVNNTASQFGGAVGAAGGPSNVTIVSTNFEGNGSPGGGGLACSVGSHVRISQGAFTQNTASRGGAILSLDCEASRSTITVDIAMAGEDLASGAPDSLCVAGKSMELDNVTFVENSASLTGGALLIEEYWSVFGKNLVFERNEAQQGGAVTMTRRGAARFQDVDFVGNSAQATGGGIEVADGIVEFSDVRFIDNSANGGGAIHGRAELGLDLNMTFTGVEFRGNSAGTLFGGGLFLSRGGFAVYLRNSTFVANEGAAGGGLTINGVSSNTRFPIVMENVVGRANSGTRLGGGFFFGTFLDVKMKNCTFTENVSGAIGGALYLSQVDSLEAIDCNFVRNSGESGSGSLLQLTAAAQSAGAIQIEQSQVNLNDLKGRILLKGCLFEGNSASSSHGAVSINDAKTVRVENCIFLGNSASVVSAAFANTVKVVQNSSFVMSDCEFIGNQVLGSIGSSILLSYPEKCNCLEHSIERTTFRENGFQHILRIISSLEAEVHLDDPNADNTGPGGDRFFSTQLFEGNQTDGVENAVLGESEFHFLIRDVQFFNNTGGIQSWLSFFPIKIENSWFEGNVASVQTNLLSFQPVTEYRSLGVCIHLSNPRAEVKNCTFVENRIVGTANGGAISIDSSIQGGGFICDGCTFKNNGAANGGAVALSLLEETDVRFANTIFDTNQAFSGFGGGLYSRHWFENNVKFDCSKNGLQSNQSEPEKKWVPVWRLFEEEGSCPGLTWRDNSALVWGADAGGPAEFVRLNTTFVPQHRSQSLLPPILVQLVDGAGTSTENSLQTIVESFVLLDPSVQNDTADGFSFRPLVRVSVVNGTGSVNGQIFSRMNEKSELVLSGVEVSAPVTGKPVNVTLQIDAQISEDSASFFRELSPDGVFEVKPATLVVEVEGCRAGELSAGDTCRECQAGTFSALAEQRFCRPCQKGGVCRNGVMVPQNEFWMLDPWAHHVVKCRTKKACQTTASGVKSGQTREDALLEFHRANPIVDIKYPSDNFTVCSPGYEGLLCGSCSEGYGRSGVECKKCGSKGATAGLVILTHALPLILISLLTSLTIRKMNRDEGPLAEGGEALSVSIVLTIGVNYFQIMSTAQFLEAEWPFSLDRLFAAQGAVGSVGLDSFANMECLMDRSNVPPSLQRVIIESLFPFIVALVASFLWQFVAFAKNIPWQRLKIYMLITTFYVLTQLYTSANTAILSLFSCFDLSTSSELATVQGKFWTEDSSIQCYTGKHLAAVILVGITGMILVSFGVPILVVAFLWVNKADLFSKEHGQKYGFLYLPYKPRSYFWTGVITARKCFVVIVVVFTGGLGPQLQTQLFGFVLFLALLLQLAIQPFQSRRHNLVETASLVISWATLFIGMYIFGGEGRVVRVSSDIRDVLTLIVLITNVALSLWFVVELGLGAKEAADKKELPQKLKTAWSNWKKKKNRSGARKQNSAGEDQADGKKSWNWKRLFKGSKDKSVPSSS
ncbi:hypothetical protein BSKO_08718 [Bryopsis sp. KO-2023]|nr:hypothetical protein BSKO_08718 [Bryopsis sp. KO-2023]